HYLLNEFTAQENVCLPMLKLGRLGRPEAMGRAAELLRRFGLADKLRRRANRLSGGEQHRVAVARALANEPQVLLADEPTGNLDSARAAELIGFLNEMRRRDDKTIVMVTHDQELIRPFADRAIKLKDGRVMESV